MNDYERFELMARAALENEKVAREAELRASKAMERAILAEERARKAEERVRKAKASLERIMQRKRAADRCWYEDFFPAETYVRCGGERLTIEELFRANMKEEDWRYT